MTVKKQKFVVYNNQAISVRGDVFINFGLVNGQDVTKEFADKILDANMFSGLKQMLLNDLISDYAKSNFENILINLSC